MQSIKPEKNGPPIPKSRHKYPWRDLKPGQSFFVKVSPGDDAEKLRRAIIACRHGGYQITTSVVRTRRTIGVRVWRCID